MDGCRDNREHRSRPARPDRRDSPDPSSRSELEGRRRLSRGLRVAMCASGSPSETQRPWARRQTATTLSQLKRRVGPGQRNFEPGLVLGITHQAIGEAEGKAIHRPGRRHAHVPVADASGIILHRGLDAGAEHIDGMRRCSESRPGSSWSCRPPRNAGDAAICSQVIQIGFDAVQRGRVQRGQQAGNRLRRDPAACTMILASIGS